MGETRYTHPETLESLVHHLRVMSDKASEQIDADRLLRVTEELPALQAENARLRVALERADRALKPFADTVFNDNGDCTISDTYLLTDVDFCNAYSARNIARAALQGETK